MCTSCTRSNKTVSFYVLDQIIVKQLVIPLKVVYFLFYYYYYCYHYGSTEEAPGGVVRCFSPRCQNGRMSHEKQWNDLYTCVESGVIISLFIHNSHTQFRWLGMVLGWCIAPA